ncbi:hypothetical protein F4824DRAFT_503582 [Ustulina deusta]|nr:hypothetical protein F4823DRAFT_567914 [Ustulina deusta]KAI3333039.1 hypothetical protein F4824DRAFT_503582 [Ustulina deusta]
MASHPVTGIPTHYEDGDEHNYSRGAIREEQKHHLHNNVKGYMRKDQKNKGMDGMIGEDIQDQVNERYKKDPLYSATVHGNQPSKGARQDAQIQAEEAEMLRKKQEKADSMPGKK